MELTFLFKASGIVFRESLEAVLIYGIIISFFKSRSKDQIHEKAAKWGLYLGILASLLLGVSLAGMSPFISPEIFTWVEVNMVFFGSLLMLYMVFWMTRNAKSLQTNLISTLSHAVELRSFASVMGAIFVAVAREGVETVVYLYSLTLENPSVSHTIGVLTSLVLGVLLAIVVYWLMLKSTQKIRPDLVFKITGMWLLCSSSSLLATGIDKVFAAGFWESYSQTMDIFALNFPDEGLGRAIVNTAESFFGLRVQPTWIHLFSFLTFWIFVVWKDPVQLFQKKLSSS